VSTRPWIRSGKGTTSSRQEMMLGSVAGSETLVLPDQESGPNAPVNCWGPV
jgi:hypothetical protein